MKGYTVYEEGVEPPVNLLSYPLRLKVEAKNNTDTVPIATWTTATGYAQNSNYQKEKFPRFFKIGTVPQVRGGRIQLSFVFIFIH